MIATERRIVGALLSGKATDLQLYADRIRLTDPLLRRVYERMQSLVSEGRDYDLHTLAAEFSGDNDITAEYLIELAEEDAIPSDIPRAVASLEDHRFRAEVSRLESTSRELTAIELSEKLQAEIWEYQRAGVPQWERRGAFQRMLESIEHDMTHGVEMVTGIGELDRIIGGLYRKEVTYIGARPSVGKSALAVNVAYHLIQQGKRVLYVDMESGDEAMMQRFTCLYTGIPLVNIHRRLLSPAQIERIIRAAAELSDMPLWINDRCGQSVGDIYQQALAVKADFVIVDYLNLMLKNSDEEVGELGDIMCGLNTMSKQLNVPVWVLGQLNRKLEDRTDKRPRMSDIRGSGKIEEFTGNIILLHWPHKYDEKELPDRYEAVISKQKHGPVGIVDLRWQPEIIKISNPIGEPQ